MGDCLRTDKPYGYIINTKVNPDFHPFRDVQIEYWLIWLGLSQCVFTCVG